MEDTRKLLDFTIPQLLRWRVKETGTKVALREKDFGYWNNYTWNDYYDHVRKVALGLVQDRVAQGRGGYPHRGQHSGNAFCRPRCPVHRSHFGCHLPDHHAR
jgi:hypothetical protein